MVGGHESSDRTATSTRRLSKPNNRMPRLRTALSRRSRMVAFTRREACAVVVKSCTARSIVAAQRDA